MAETVEKYQVVFVVGSGGNDLHTEDVFASDQLTAVARAAWATALKGYSLLEVKSALIDDGKEY